jgi:hypothetical protein
LVRVSLLLAALASPALADRIDPSQLLPVVRDAGLDGYRGVDLAGRPITPGLTAYLVTDQGGQVQFLLAEDVADTGLTDDEAWARAIANQIAKGVPRQVQVAPGVTSMEQDAENESALILDLPRWRQLASDTGQLIAVVPNNHVLIYGDADVAGTAAALQGVADYAAGSLEYPLSPVILEWTGDGWAPFQP